MSLCDIRNLSKSYPSFVLSDIFFELNTGRIIGFIGRNRASKITTIKSALGFVHPYYGEICYFGLCVRQLKTLRRLIYNVELYNEEYR